MHKLNFTVQSRVEESMAFHYHLPLRISLPLSVVVGGVLLSALFFLWNMHDAQTRLRDEVARSLQDTAKQVIAGLNEEQGRSDEAHQDDFSSRTRQPHLVAAVLLDTQGTVQLAQQEAWRSQPVQRLTTNYDAERAARAAKSGRPLFFQNDTRRTFSLYQPIHLADISGKSTSTRQNILWLEYDFHELWDAVISDALERGAVLFTSLLAIAAVLWWALYRRIAVRLSRLSEATQRLADGDLSQRAHIGGQDEISQLANSFNAMAEALANEQRQRAAQQTALALSEQRHRSLFESSQDFIAIFDLDLHHTDANPAYIHMLGYSLEELRQLSYFQVSDHQNFEQERARLAQEIFERGYSDEFEKEFLRKDGSRCPVSIKAVLMRDEHGQACGIWGIGRDISLRKKNEAALKLSAKVYAASHEGIIVTDPERIILTANDAYSEITGYPPAETVGHKPRFLLSDHYSESFYSELLDIVLREGFWQGEIIGRRKCGELYPVWVTITAAHEDGQLEHYIITFSDITERKKSEDQIRHLAEHDFLTDLPNRVLLLDRLNQQLAHCRRNQGQFALMFIDLDRFKQINDTLGHHIGDLLLQAVAQRLKQTLRESDTVSRQGGDEFVILLQEAGQASELATLASKLMQKLTQPYKLEEHEFSISASIGIALYPDDGEDIDTLIRNADTAMYHAKQSGRSQFQFFAESMNAKVSERVLLENRLRKAMAQGHMQLHYQPKVEIGSHQITGAEALLRWIDPAEGMISPSRFIPAAEECGLIIELGEWVLRTACFQARQWLDNGLTQLVVSVNVSAVQFRQPNLAELVAQTLRDSGLPGDRLELELTEGMLMEQPEAASATMAALKQMGVRLSLDDFGTGYSSLSYLKRFPFDALKIDQSFVRDLGSNADDDSLVRTIILMAKNLNMRAIAEGVETSTQLDFLSANDCDEFQGFLRSQAVPASELEQLIKGS